MTIPKGITKMRGVVAVSPGGPEVLKLADLSVPSPGPDQVLVRVRAAALNQADLLQRAGEFPAPEGESEILGVEIAGDIVSCGSNVQLPLGSAVFGLVGGGAYADYCLLDAQMAIAIPPGFSYAEAAALPEVFFTANTTMFELGGLVAGQTVLVHGGGSGLGSACIQMAKRAGAMVACTVGSEAKAARAQELGADLSINYRTQDFVREVLAWTGGVGVDLVEDIIGADYFERNLSALKDGGCLVQVGVMSGTKCALDLDAIVLRRLQLKGSIMRALPVQAKRAITERFRERWLPLLAARELSPVIDSVFPVADVLHAHVRMQRSEHFGKIILDLHRANDVAVSGLFSGPHFPREKLSSEGELIMTGVSAEQVEKSLIDISGYDLDLSGPDVLQTGELPERIIRLLTSESGYCVLYGTNKILASHGLDIHADRMKAYELLESVFKSAVGQIDMREFSVTPRPMTFTKMDVDGYNLNESFSHDGNIASRAFMTSKCLHFDAATPFIGNIYGPNENIGGGHPVICDVKSFCRDRGLRASQLVENIPNNYNIAIKEEFYEDLKDNYSFGLQLNLDTDIIIVILLNEIDFGVAHGATNPYKHFADKPAKRPIRHFEYLYAEENHYDEWYGYYGLGMLPASDYQGENLSLDYHQPARQPYQNLVRVNN
jgi:putative PIG3 family NAD(P)H quinone oxidoreductase